MASKQLGKLRQWGREVISSKEKTVLTREFIEAEQDVELRRAGIERLHNACGEYHGYLQKKKEYSHVEEGVKMLPVDALGAVMMSHGEEFGENSAFGQGLVKVGRAHCKIATLQETFALAFRDTYLASLQGSLDEFSDYTLQRKKLDSRRLTYDAAATKASKAKKEKEVKEAEEELTKAKLRYEETSTDVQARMQAIQENEIRQLRDLADLLATETRFVEQYLDVLRDARDDWLDESLIYHTETPRRKAAPHAFGRSTPSISSTSRTTTSATTSRATTPVSDDDGDGDQGFSVKRRESPAGTPRPSSRGSTRSAGTAHNRKYSHDSVGSDGVSGNKRVGVAGWASSAVSSLSGSGRSKKDPKKDRIIIKDRDKKSGRAFASLENASESDDDGIPYEDAFEDEEFPRSRSQSLSSSVMGKVLGQTPPMSIQQRGQPFKSSSSNSSSNSMSADGSSVPSASRRVMRAMFDFSGSSDELSFRTGDEIAVLSEPKGGWSMGEVSGRRGLFPINYTEEIPAFRGRVAPLPFPPLPPRMTTIAQRALTDTTSEEDGTSIISEDMQDIGPPLRLYDDDEPFGDHHLVRSPLATQHTHEQEISAEFMAEDEDDMRGLFGPVMPDIASSAPARFTDRGIEIGNADGNSIPSGHAFARQPPALPQRKPSARKAPPPPPPARRLTTSASANGPSVSAPSSTAVFPSLPASRRATLIRSANADMQTTPSDTISPFEN